MDAVSLHSLRAADGSLLLAAAWVSHVPAPPPPPVPVPPTYTAVNPLAPYAVVHPERVYDPFNAARLAAPTLFSMAACTRQSPSRRARPLPSPPIGRAWSSDEDDPAVSSVNPADMRLQIGLDPAGGTNPNGAGVVWSAERQSPGSLCPLYRLGHGRFPRLTLFLRARPDGVRAHNEAIWDRGGTKRRGAGQRPFGDLHRWHPRRLDALLR
jgi:hypothetical protein